jgi:hypothetical protein
MGDFMKPDENTCKKCWCSKHCGGDKYLCLVPACIMEKVVKKK